MARPTLHDRYWAKVDRNGPLRRPDLGRCWEWTAAKKEKGYGVLGRTGRRAGVILATHVSWEIHRGPVPPGLWLLHRCDFPPCTNPDHLFLGTSDDNIADMRAKGRHVHGECSYSKITESVVIDIRTLTAFGAGNGDLARAFGVSRALVSMIVNRQRWAHLP